MRFKASDARGIVGASEDVVCGYVVKVGENNQLVYRYKLAAVFVTLICVGGAVYDARNVALFKVVILAQLAQTFVVRFVHVKSPFL